MVLPVRVLLLFFLGACLCNGTRAQTHFSEPLHFAETGWNKTLIACNGNTLLFHFVPRRAIEILVYDSLGNQIAASKHPGGDFNINALPRTVFKGLFNVGDEAALFLQQEWYGQNTIFRFRFNTKTGRLIEEIRLARGKSGAVVKGPDGYAVIAVDGANDPERTDHISVERYDATHTRLRKTGLGWIAEKELKQLDPLYGMLSDVHADLQGGVFFTVLCTGGKRVVSEAGRSTNIHRIHFRMGWEDSTLLYAVTKFQAGLKPEYALTSWDPQSNTDRHLFMNSISYQERGNEGSRYYLYQGNYLVQRHEDLAPLGSRQFMPADTSIIRTSSEHVVLKGNPIYMERSQNGGILLFSEITGGKRRYAGGRWYYNTLLGSVIVQELRANGTPLWEVLLPKIQYAAGTLFPEIIQARNWNNAFPITTSGTLDYNTLASFDVMPGGVGKWFVVYNQPKPDTSAGTAVPIWDLRTATAMVGVVWEDGTKALHPLFKTDEHEGSGVAAILESGYFDSNRGIYTAVILCDTGGHQDVKLAWCPLPVSE